MNIYEFSWMQQQQQQKTFSTNHNWPILEQNTWMTIQGSAGKHKFGSEQQSTPSLFKVSNEVKVYLIASRLKQGLHAPDSMSVSIKDENGACSNSP